MEHDHDEPVDAIELLELRPQKEHRNSRLDRYIADAVPHLSRSYLRSLVDEGLVTVDDLPRKASFKVTPGEVIAIRIPPTEAMALVPEAIPLDVLYEDEDIIVVNKAAGLVVHPAPGHASGTLVNALLYHAPDISISGSNRPGIVHRLDKDTSGVMVVAKRDQASQSLVEQWQQGKVRKHYLAVVAGQLVEDEAVVDVPIARHRMNRRKMAVDRDGRAAVSVITVNERLPEASLLDVDLRTGRTHQIRVHLSFIKHPIIGDSVYGNGTSQRIAHDMGVRRQLLHAASLGFALPATGEHVGFQAPMPDDFAHALNALRSEETGQT